MIISDSTIIITLINIDEFEILKLFIEKIIIPKEVYDEVSLQINAKIYLDKEILLGFITVERYKDEKIFKEINFILDTGESASITLAIENKMPLIIDEKKGRKFAQKQGLEIIGLIGILRFLYIENKITKDKTLLLVEKLNLSSFRISQKLLALILKS